MKIRALTTDGDFVFGRGKSSYLADDAAINLNLQTRLKSWIGDCFFDINAGIDWLNRTDKNQKDNLLNDLRSLILQSYGVVGVSSVTSSLDPDTRAFSVQYSITTIYSSSFTSAVSLANGTGR